MALDVALLLRRTRLRTEGTVHAAVAGFGREHNEAVFALVEPLASVGRHRLRLDVATFWAGER